MISGIFMARKGAPRTAANPGKTRNFPATPLSCAPLPGTPLFAPGETSVAKAAASSPEAAGNAAGSTLDPLDLYGVRAALSEEERLVQESVARLVDAEVLPIIQRCFEEHRFPKELIPKLAALGLLGSSIQGYDCAGLNAIAYGLICHELDAGES